VPTNNKMRIRIGLEVSMSRNKTERNEPNLFG